MAFNLTANLNVAVNTGALKAAANQINSTLGSVNNLKIGTNSATFASIRPLKAQIVESTDAIENFGKQAGFAAKRFAAFSVTAGAMIGFIQTIKSAVGSAIDFDREMVRLSQVSNDSAQDVAGVGQEITRLSTGLGVSSQDLVKVAVTLKQANLSLKDTKIALEAMAQAALAPNFDNLKDTTEGAIAIMNQFKISASGLSGALGAVNVVAGEFAVEAGDIIEAVRKTGGAFKAAGGNLNELIALFTAVRQTTRESAESIGTGLRTIFTRIQRNDTAAALKEVGINLRYTRDEAIALGDAGLEQQFVGPYEAVKRLSEGLNQLRSTDPRFSAIVEQLGGYRQISKVIPLIQEFGTAQKALGIAQAGSVSLALNAGQAQDALAVKLQKLKETFLDVGRNIVNSPGFRSLVDVFINGSTAALRLLDSLKGLIPVLAAIAAVKIGQGLVSFGTGFIKGAAGDGKTNKKADGGFIRMQKGGIVPGSGSGDKVPALLEPGEMVIPKKYASGGTINSIKDKTKKVMLSSLYDTKPDLDEYKINGSIKRIPLSTPYEQNRINAEEILNSAKNVYQKSRKNKVSAKQSTILANEELNKAFESKGATRGDLGFLKKKYFKTKIGEGSNSQYNQIAGRLGESDTEKQMVSEGSKFKRLPSRKGLDFIKDGNIGVETKTTQSQVSDEEIIAKALLNKGYGKAYKNKKPNTINLGNLQVYESYIGQKRANGGSIYRQRFMEGEEVRSQSEFLKNTFRPGYSVLKDALKESGSLKYLRPIQSSAGKKGSFEDLASSNDKDFWAETEANIGKRKTDQFRRFYERQKNIEIEKKKYFDERRAKNPLALPEANPKYSEALQASMQKQEESQNQRIAKSFYAYKEDYEKNATASTEDRKKQENYVSRTMGNFSPSTGVSRVFRKPENFDPKEERDTLKHERIHAIQKDSLRSNSPLKNSLFNIAGQQSESSLTPGKQTFLAEVQANYGAKSTPSEKRKSALEFAGSKYDATTYKSQYHMDIADRIGMPKFDRSVIRAQKNREKISREGSDNPEVIAANKALSEILDKQPKKPNKKYGDSVQEAVRILKEKIANSRGPNWQKRLDAADEIAKDKSWEQISRKLALGAEQSQKFAFGGNVVRQKFASGKFVAKDTKGNIVRDSVDAATEEEMRQKIRQMGYVDIISLDLVAPTKYDTEKKEARKKIARERAKEVRRNWTMNEVDTGNQYRSMSPPRGFYGTQERYNELIESEKDRSLNNQKGLRNSTITGAIAGGLAGAIAGAGILSLPGASIGAALGAFSGTVAGGKLEVSRRNKYNKDRGLARFSYKDDSDNKNYTIPARNANEAKERLKINRSGNVSNIQQLPADRTWGEYLGDKKKSIFGRKKPTDNLAMAKLGLTAFSGSGFGAIGATIGAIAGGVPGAWAGGSLGTVAGLGIGFLSNRYLENQGSKEQRTPIIKGNRSPLSEEEIARMSGGKRRERKVSPIGQKSFIGQISETPSVPETTTSYPAYQQQFDSSSLAKIREERKKRLGYASGGLVPGTGNSDTVPMDLDEGSFVIKKSSVNKIGAQNLAGVHKFKSGGKVPALLTPGEYVYSPSEAKKIGSSKLHQMNSYGELKKFAKGGEIGKTLIDDTLLSVPANVAKIKKALIQQLMSENKDLSKRQASQEASRIILDIEAKNTANKGVIQDVAQSDSNLKSMKGDLQAFQTLLKEDQKGLKAFESEVLSLTDSLGKLKNESLNLTQQEKDLAARIAAAETAKSTKQAAGPDLTQENKKVTSAQTKVDALNQKKTEMEKARQAKEDAATRKLAEAEQAKRTKEAQPVDVSRDIRRIGNITGNISVLNARREEKLDKGQSTDIIDAQIEEQKRKRRVVQAGIVTKQAAGPDTKKEQKEIDKAKAQLAEAKKPIDSTAIDTKITAANAALASATAARAAKVSAGADTKKEDEIIRKLKEDEAKLNKKIGENAAQTILTGDKIKDTNKKIADVKQEILNREQDISVTTGAIAVEEKNRKDLVKKGQDLTRSYQTNAKGQTVNEKGELIGKKTSDRGTLKREIIQEQKRTGATGKEAKAVVASRITDEYQEKIFQQLRSVAVGKKQEFDPDLARAKAADLTQQAIEGKRKLSRDAQGNIIGDKKLGRQLESMDRSASGKLGFFERAPKEKKTKEQRQEDKAQRAANISSGIQTGSMFVAGAGAYLASGMKERAGSAESVIGRGDVFGSAPVEKQGKSEAFKESYARAGSLEKATSYGAAGASAGAAVGAIFGPVGIAIGAGAGVILGGLVGATKGYADGLKEAEAQIREVKIARSVENLQNIFERVGNGLQDFDASIGESIKANQKVLAEEGGKKAFDVAGGNRDFIDKIFKGGLNVDELQTQLEKNSKQNQAQQLVGLTSIVNKQAEKAGRQAFAGQMAGGAIAGGAAASINFNDIQESIKKGFLEANGGFNKDAIAQIASSKNITFEAAEREFIKVIRDSFKTAQLQKTQDLAVKANTNAITSMEMLANAVNAAALASEAFSEKMKTNTSLFEGTISGTTISSLSNQLSNKSTPDLSAYNKALDQIAASLGTYGEEFKAQGSALNVASQELPSILASVVESPIGGADAGVQIADALTRALEAKGIKGEAASRIVNSVAGGVAGQDYTKFLADAGGNVGKAAEKLLENLKGPFLQASRDIADKLQNASNGYIQGLVELANRQKQVRQSFELIDSKKLQRDKFAAEQKAKGIGLPSQASEFISYDRATQGFKNKQARLTENVVGGGEDPREIYKRLQKVQDQIKPQEEKVQQASLSEKGGETFRNAANELLKLKSEASNLNEALKNLSDQSERLSAAQEKLAKIQRDRETELSIGKRLLTGGPEARQRFGQGQQLLNVAQSQGFNIGNFNDEQAKILFEFVDQFGEKGKDISDQIVKSTTGLGVGTKGKQKEEAALTNEITRIMNAQVEAQQLLTANQRTLQQEYFATLNQQNTTFYAKLDAFVAAMQDQQKKGFINIAEQNVAKLKSAKTGSSFLRESGVTDENLAMVNKNRSLITEIIDANKRRKSSEQVESKITNEKDISKYFGNSLKGIVAGGSREANAKSYAINFEGIKTALSGLGVQGDSQQNAILQEFLTNLSDTKNQGVDTAEILRKAIIDGLVSSRSAENLTINEKIAKTGDTQNLFKKIAENAENKNINVDQINTALDAVINLGEGIDTKLTTAIERAQNALNSLTAPAVVPPPPAVGVAPAAAAPVVQAPFFSLGGTAFAPRGTDTVPAMLTPGEFIVNKNATQQNLPLLQSINSGKTSYLSKGGQVSYFNMGGPVELAEFPEDAGPELTKYNAFIKLNSNEAAIEQFKNVFPLKGPDGKILDKNSYITSVTKDDNIAYGIAEQIWEYNNKQQSQEGASEKFLRSSALKLDQYKTQNYIVDNDKPLKYGSGGLNGLRIDNSTAWSDRTIGKGLIEKSIKAIQDFYKKNENIFYKTTEKGAGFQVSKDGGIERYTAEGFIKKPNFVEQFPNYNKQIENYKNKFYNQDNFTNIVNTKTSALDSYKKYNKEDYNLYNTKNKQNEKIFPLKRNHFDDLENEANSIDKNEKDYTSSEIKNLDKIFPSVFYNLINEDKKEIENSDRTISLKQWRSYAQSSGGKFGPPTDENSAEYYPFIKYSGLKDAKQAQINNEFDLFGGNKPSIGQSSEGGKTATGIVKEIEIYINSIRTKQKEYENKKNIQDQQIQQRPVAIAADNGQGGGVEELLNAINIDQLNLILSNPKADEIKKRQARFKIERLKKIGSGSYYGGKNLISSSQFSQSAEDGSLVYKNNDLIKNLKNDQYGKQIALEDTVLQGRRGNPQRIAEIFKRRQLEANTVVGKMLRPKVLEDMNKENQDAKIKELSEAGSLFLKEEQQTGRLAEKDLRALPQQQLAIVKSYIENSEFNKTAALKGEDFLSLVGELSIPIAGRENEKDQPRKFVGFEDYLKKKLKDEDDPKTFFGSKDIIESRAKGKYKALMFQSAELGKAGGQLSYKQLEEKIKRDKNFNIVDKLAGKQKIQKTTFAMPVTSALFDNESGYYYLESPKVKEKGFLASLNNDAFVGMSFPEEFATGEMSTDKNQPNGPRFKDIQDIKEFAKQDKAVSETYGSRFGLLTFKNNQSHRDYRKEGENETFLTIGKEDIINLFKNQGGTTIIESEAYKEKTGDNGESKINYDRKIKSMVWETEKSATQQRKLIKEIIERQKDNVAAAPAAPAADANANVDAERERFFAAIGEVDPRNLDDKRKELYTQRMTNRLRNGIIDPSQYKKYVQNRAKGGMINYLANGGVPSYAPNPDPSYFKPMGTDTVPAMLTPGEFVVNASATAKHGDLLSAINSGQDVSALALGGKVNYLYSGGYTRSTAIEDARSKGIEQGSWGDMSMMAFEQNHIQEKNMAGAFYQNSGLGALAETGFGADAAKSINIAQSDLTGANSAASSGVSSVYDAIKQGGGPGDAFGGLSYRNDAFNQSLRMAKSASEQQKIAQQMMEEVRKQQEEWDNLPEDEKQKILAKQNVDQILSNAASNSLNVGQYKDQGYGSQLNLMRQRDKIWGTTNYNKYENMQLSSAMADANRNALNVGQYQRYGRGPVNAVYGQQRAQLKKGAGPYERAKYARFSKGGIAYLQSGGNVDNQPAMLSEGEFVVNKDSAKKHGGLLNYINKGKEVKKYSKGGGVGVSYLQGGGPAEAQSGSPTQVDGTAIKNAAMTIYAASEKIINASIKSLEAGRQMIVGGISNAQSASKFLSSSASNLNSSQQMSQSSVDFGSYSQSLGNTLSGFGESISGFSQSLDGFISGITDEFSKLDSTLRNNFGNFSSSIASFAISVDQLVTSISGMTVKHEHKHKWDNELNVNVKLDDNNIINSSELKQLILDTIRGEEFNGI